MKHLEIKTTTESTTDTSVGGEKPHDKSANKDNTLAARFFFRNCAVSLHLPCEMRISRTLKPGPDDVVINRDFTPAGTPTEFIGSQSDFYRFLGATSTTNTSLIKKLAAIGYILCNKLPRGGRRCRAFLCINEDPEARGNGKSLFAQSLAQLCNIQMFPGGRYRSFPFVTPVSRSTQLFFIDDFFIMPNWQKLYTLCTDDWIIKRKNRNPKRIPIAEAPYVLATTNLTASQLPVDGSFRHRFVTLEFSSFFNIANSVRVFLGQNMFFDWDKTQWHMFDNFMFYCVLEYLRAYSAGKDVFSFYE